MKAITLWQPYASAIANGVKQIETRSWSTNYRGEFLVHAAKRWTREQSEFILSEQRNGRCKYDMPRGAIVAVARLDSVKLSEHLVDSVSWLEALYGDFAPNRFGWVLRDVRPIVPAIPWRGTQGFFEVPDHVVRGHA